MCWKWTFILTPQITPAPERTELSKYEFSSQKIGHVWSLKLYLQLENSEIILINEFPLLNMAEEINIAVVL